MWRGWVTIAGLAICRWAWAIYERDWMAIEAAEKVAVGIGVLLVAIALLVPDHKEKDDVE